MLSLEEQNARHVAKEEFKILVMMEGSWRQKVRKIWLKEGIHTRVKIVNAQGEETQS